MRTLPILWIMAGLAATLPLAAAQQTCQQESLGDVARQVRQERQKAPKPAKVFTNDDIPPAVAPASGPGSEKPAEGEKTKESAAQPPSPETAPEKGTSESGPSEAAMKDRVYWQAKFKTAREALAKAKEEQQLAEDELNLLQIQQARDFSAAATFDTTAKDQLDAKIRDKQSQVEAKKAATEEAEKTLDALDRAFKESGAPEEWSVTESPLPPDPAPSSEWQPGTSSPPQDREVP